MNPMFLLDRIPWFAWIAIVAIVCGAINGVVSTLARHRERMAMIGQGMYPDAGPEEEDGSSQGCCSSRRRERGRAADVDKARMPEL